MEKTMWQKKKKRKSKVDGNSEICVLKWNLSIKETEENIVINKRKKKTTAEPLRNIIRPQS